MREKLFKKLSSPSIERSMKWFWEKHIKDQLQITYGYFMGMMNGTSTMRDDVKEAINEFLNQD